MQSFVSHTSSTAVHYLVRRVGNYTRLASGLMALGVVCSAYGSAPDGQTVDAIGNVGLKYLGVVRVMQDYEDADGNELVNSGTGTIIDGHVDAKGNYMLCVLTAAHVVLRQKSWTGTSAYKVGILNSSAGINFSASVVGNAGILGIGKDRPDLAVMKVTLSAQGGKGAKYWYDILSKLKFSTGPLNVQGAPFTEVGFGLTGTALMNQGALTGYRPTDGTYGTERFYNLQTDKGNFTFNEKGDAADPWVGVPGNALTGQAYTWDATDPKNLAGAGVSFSGDSGAPMLISGDDKIGDIGVKTTGLSGVVIGTPGNRAKGDILLGDSIQGVALNLQYRRWIDSQCQLVPEPTPIVVTMAGVLGLCLRRRKQA